MSDLTGLLLSLEARDNYIARLQAEKAKVETELTIQRLSGQDMCTQLANARAYRKEVEGLRAELAGKVAEILALKEELDLLNRNHAKLLARRDEQIARSVAALESVRVSRFWKLVIESGFTPKHAKAVISEAEEIVKDLGKPA